MSILLDENAAAAVLSLSPKTLRKWRCLGGGPAFVKLGAAVRYERAALDAWVAEQRRFSTAEAATAGRLGRLVSSRPDVR